MFIRQILIELHWSGNVMQENTLFHTFAKNGYAIFHKEANIYGSDGDCVEFAFIKLNLAFGPSSIASVP